MPLLPPELLTRIICPVCGAPLSRTGDKWSCGHGHRYPEYQGVPLLRANLEEEPALPRGGDGFVGVKTILKPKGVYALARKILGTNYEPFPCDKSVHIAEGALSLNVGAGMSDGAKGRMINLDYFAFDSVDTVADAQAIPFMDDTFDYVQSEFMLEHVRNPMRVCRELTRVLKPGGVLYVSYPFIHAYHSFPGDYFRYTYSGMQELFSDLNEIERGPLSGPACAWLAQTADMVSFISPSKAIQPLLRALGLCCFFPIKYLDYFLNKRVDALDHAVTAYAVFRKPDKNVQVAEQPLSSTDISGAD